MAVLIRTSDVPPAYRSEAWITNAGRATAGTIPAAIHRVLESQTHNVSAQALAPELLEFSTA